MATNEKLTEVLNDLIEINNDRVAGYEKAAKETESIDVDLQAIFHSMSNDSRKYAAELTQEVKRLGGEPSTGSTNSGKIYRAWMDVRAALTKRDRHAIVSSCEYGEDAAQKAYDEALATDAELPTEIRQLITDQKSKLKSSHDKIKKMRDTQPA